MQLGKKEIWEGRKESKVMCNEGLSRAGNGCKNLKYWDADVFQWPNYVR